MPSSPPRNPRAGELAGSPPSADAAAHQGVLEFYKAKQRIYHTLESHPGRRDTIVLTLLPPNRPLRVLDIGCGSGRFLRVLQGLGHEVLGLEISAAAVDVANRSGVHAIVGDVESGTGLNAVGADFDVVTMLDVLEHTFDPAHVLQSLTPLLKPNGCFIVSVPNVACFTARWQIMCGRFPSEASGIFDSGHIRWFAVSNLVGYIPPTNELALESCTATGVPVFQLRGYSRLQTAHELIFASLARIWPSLFGYQLIFKVTRVR